MTFIAVVDFKVDIVCIKVNKIDNIMIEVKSLAIIRDIIGMTF